ncbi:hypothetical protein [Aliihoeflea sp. PC F10.4]
MTRYVAIRPTADSDWDAKATDSLASTLHETERKPIDTGLLNASGAKLYRMEDQAPIGFIHHAVMRGR